MATKDPWWNQKGGDDFDGINGMPSPYVNDSADADSPEAQQAAENIQHLVRQFVSAQRQNFANSQISSYNAVMELPNMRVHYRNFNGQENIRFSPTVEYPTTSSEEQPVTPPPSVQGLCLLVLYNQNQWAVFDMNALPALSQPLDADGTPLLSTFTGTGVDWGDFWQPAMQMPVKGTSVIMSYIDFAEGAINNQPMITTTSSLLSNQQQTNTNGGAYPIFNVSQDTPVTVYCSQDVYTLKPDGSLSRQNDGGMATAEPFAIDDDGTYYYNAYCGPPFGQNTFKLGLDYTASLYTTPINSLPSDMTPPNIQSLWFYAYGQGAPGVDPTNWELETGSWEVQTFDDIHGVPHYTGQCGVSFNLAYGYDDEVGSQQIIASIAMDHPGGGDAHRIDQYGQSSASQDFPYPIMNSDGTYTLKTMTAQFNAEFTPVMGTATFVNPYITVSPATNGYSGFGVAFGDTAPAGAIPVGGAGEGWLDENSEIPIRTDGAPGFEPLMEAQTYALPGTLTPAGTALAVQSVTGANIDGDYTDSIGSAITAAVHIANYMITLQQPILTSFINSNNAPPDLGILANTSISAFGDTESAPNLSIDANDINAEPFPFSTQNGLYYVIQNFVPESDSPGPWQVVTPYQTYKFTPVNQFSTSFAGWLQISNASHLLQGFLYGDNDNGSNYGLYCDGTSIMDQLTDALNCSPVDIVSIFMDIPYNVVSTIGQGASGI